MPRHQQYKTPQWKAYMKRWKEENREKVLEYGRRNHRKHREQQLAKMREYHARTRDRQWERNLIRLYGIDAAQFHALLASQGGGCAICGATSCGDRRRSRMHVDHDHSTGRVRGLLCSQCNKAIGLLRDRPEILRSAATYLERTVTSLPPAGAMPAAA